MTKEEALLNVVYQAAEALAEGALNAGEGQQFLLDHGWTEAEIQRDIHREISKQDMD